jgi:asparagine synthase (glutamine-hydrolysing)
MSTLGGLFVPHSVAPDPAILAALARALAPRSPDGVRQTAAPEIGMVYGALNVVPGPHPEQPMRRGSLLLAWDGRLDNRRDLRQALGVERGASDLDLLVPAYERWGPDVLAHLVGDFALALWDGRERRLLLARDPLGTRPLFYALSGKGLVWASTLGALRAVGTDPGEVDEEWMAGYFSWSIDPATTPWQGFRAVPPGRVLMAGTERLRVEPFWRLDEAREVRLATDAEYEERFRELFLESVRCRLRAAGPVTSELSGGLDSSSIVCAADDLLRAGAAIAPGLLTVSHVYERSTTADESPFIREVEARIGRCGRHLCESEAPPLARLAETVSEIPSSLHCFGERYRAVYRYMGENGSRVLLTGFGGDHLLTSEVAVPYELADLLQAGRLRAFLAALRHWRDERRKPYLQLLWAGALCPLLPRPVRLRVARPPIPFPRWLDRGFVRRRDLAARFVSLADAAGDFPCPSKREQAAAVAAAIRGLCWLYDRWDFPVEIAVPFMDRRLVEFCLGVPSDQFVRPGQTRSLHRRALAGLLPPRIAARKDKRGPEEPALRAFGERWGEIQGLLDEPRIVQRGWVEPAAFRHALQEARFGKMGDNLLALMAALALEAWLRAGERRHGGS